MGFSRSLSRAFFIVSLLSGCGTPNAIPTYLALQPFQITVNPSQGTASQKITDAWVFVGNDLNGVYAVSYTHLTLPTIYSV